MEKTIIFKGKTITSFNPFAVIIDEDFPNEKVFYNVREIGKLIIDDIEVDVVYVRGVPFNLSDGSPVNTVNKSLRLVDIVEQNEVCESLNNGSYIVNEIESSDPMSVINNNHIFSFQANATLYIESRIKELENKRYKLAYARENRLYMLVNCFNKYVLISVCQQ